MLQVLTVSAGDPLAAQLNDIDDVERCDCTAFMCVGVTMPPCAADVLPDNCSSIQRCCPLLRQRT
jgi:hypothetical protein